MFEHLTAAEFDDLADVDTPTLLAAQASTADWLDELGSPEHLLTEDDKDRARQAFTAVTNPDMTPAVKKEALLALRVPDAVKHLAGMLSAYDWEFVEQAKQLRGYVVAGLLEETKSPDARIRLKSLELVGKLTEVASFSDRVEIIHKHEDNSVIEERLRSRLRSLLPPVQEVQDSEVKDIAIVRHEPPKKD